MTNDSLNYEALKLKANREIARLRQAESRMEIVEAIDHALNAAFTVYHLLEWRENPSGLTKDELGRKVPGAYGLCKKLKDPYFNLLHGIVTHTKHTTISTQLPDENSAPQHIPVYKEDIGYICTKSGDKILTECGHNIVTENSKIIVYFGEEIAKHVLDQTLKEFD